MPIASLFSIVLGLIVLISVGTVLALTTVSARLDLVEGLADESDLALGAIMARVDDHLSIVDGQLAYMRDLIVEGDVPAGDDAQLAFALEAALAATKQVTAIAFMRPDASSVRVERPDGATFVNDLAERTEVVAAMREAEARGADGDPMGWSEPLFSPNVGRTIIVRREAVWQGERFLGILFAGVDLFALSGYAKELSASLGQTVFVLHGREDIIAHPKLTEGTFAPSLEQPMATIDGIGDNRFRQIWRPDITPVISQDSMTLGQGHYFYEDGEWQVFVYVETSAYGNTPWLIGFHYDSSMEGTEVRQFWWVLGIAVGMLFLFIGLGGLLGRRMARPFRHLTDNAIAIQRMDLGAYRPLTGSRIVELDRAARAFDAMFAGLRVFERYVPKRLVEMIVREGREKIDTDQRQLTILFIDIVGFSQMAEAMTPQATAALLNDHFARIGACIDGEGGTIDKYIGDGLLAFWSAPEKQHDHADRACRAALAIERVLSDHNRTRRERGEPPIQVRIGIHTGDAIVGDIGAESRINYTAIGDTVNVASRVEAAGRQHMQGDVTILVTEETLAATTGEFVTEPLGPTTLRGRNRPTVLFRLVGSRGAGA